jgi:arylsulfatase A-like enzyme
MKAIDDAGIAQDTLVIFTGDNGHSHYTGWEKLIAAGHKPSGPYRGHKGDIWEGGHRVPLIARWPGRVAANTQSAQLVCLTDTFATVAEIVGTELPPAAAEDSFSFLPALLGKTAGAQRRTTLVNHSNPGEFAYRDGPWKLVFRNSAALQQARGKPTIVELYNLETDIAEQKDLAAQKPEVVSRMRTALEQLIARGSSRGVAGAKNDTEVRVDITKLARWGPEAR